MKIGDCVRLRTKEGPLMCINNTESMLGEPLSSVYCCYWHVFKEEFVYVALNRDMLEIVDPVDSSPDDE
jgi:hypothetical protein